MKANRKVLFVLLLSSLLVSCSQETTGSAAAQDEVTESGGNDAAAIEALPAIDNRSPDSVIKTHWALYDWMQTNSCKLTPITPREREIAEYRDALTTLGSGSFLEEQLRNLELGLDPCAQASQSRFVFQREIVEVKSESETRSVVFAKIRNVTPIPDGVNLNRQDLAKRNYGNDLKYVVEKTEGGWRLAEAWSRDLEIVALLSGREEPDEWRRVWASDAEASAQLPMSYNYDTVFAH